MRADAVKNPFAHLGAAYRRDLAASNFLNSNLYFVSFRRCVLHRRHSQTFIKQDATVVNALIDVIIEQLVIGQLPLGLTDRPHGAHVLLAVRHHLGHQVFVVAECAVRLWDRQQPDKLAAAMILAHPRPSEPAHVFQATRRAVGAGLCCGAVELIQIEIDLQDVPENQPLERCVVRAYLAGVVHDGLRERLAGPPRPHVVVVKGVGHAQHIGASVLCVVIDAAGTKVAAAPGFKVDPQGCHGASLTCYSPGRSNARPGFRTPT